MPIYRRNEIPSRSIRGRLTRGLAVIFSMVAWSFAWGGDPIMDLLVSRGVQLAPAEALPHGSGQTDAAAQQPTLPERRSAALVYAMAYVGVPYRRGGTGFEEGVDCSGFVQVTFRETLGVSLPRRAAQQAQATLAIDPTELAPGDLVFFNTLGEPYSHVGIYVGQGRFVHSPRSGAHVRLERMDEPYWRSRFDGARRVVAEPSG
jgi:cell wall-associated NlpC family hydrolase